MNRYAAAANLLIAVAVIAVVAGGGAAFSTWWQGRPLLGAQWKVPAPVQVVDDVHIDIAGDAMLGSPEAEVVVIEFSDYECSFCGAYHREVFRDVRSQLIAAGRVQYAYKHFPMQEIHPLALKAAEAAECAGQQGRFWDMHDRLFEHQSELSTGELVAHAATLGLDLRIFSECFDSRTAPMIREDMSAGMKAEIAGTPTFLVGIRAGPSLVRVARRITGAIPYSAFEAVVQEVQESAVMGAAKRVP